VQTQYLHNSSSWQTPPYLKLNGKVLEQFTVLKATEIIETIVLVRGQIIIADHKFLTDSLKGLINE